MNLRDRLNLIYHKIFLKIDDEPLICPGCGREFSRWDWKFSGLDDNNEADQYILNEERDLYILLCPKCFEVRCLKTGALSAVEE